MSNAPFLETGGLNANQKQLFTSCMQLLDNNFSLPLLWKSPKLSAWYSVGLLARQKGDDVAIANKLLANIVTQQFLDKSYEKNYGSFKQATEVPYCDRPNNLWEDSEVYDAYDPNNGLFVTMAGVMIHSLFLPLIDPKIWAKFAQSMQIACVGQSFRAGGKNGDDLYASYTNPWFLRCICSAYVGNMTKDEKMIKEADAWTQESVDLFDLYSTPGEFNSPTYAGVTLMALGLAQYCPPSSTIHKIAPRLMTSLWDSLGEVYNPSLLNMAGPWDRGYGFCMTQYYATTGIHIAAIVGSENPHPMPTPLNGSDHYSDAALIPMQMLTSPFIESSLSESTRAKFFKLYAPHSYTPKSIFPPHDKNPRKYTFWLEEGLNVGGIEFDEDQIGGPKGIDTQFNPGVVQWDSGKHGGGCGWISLWPTHPSCSIIATKNALTIKYLPSTDFPSASSLASTKISLHIGCIPFFQLDSTSFSNGKVSFPGLDVTLTGNAFEQGERTVSFSKKQKLHGAYYYDVTFEFGGMELKGGEPTLEIQFQKTTPPVYELQF